MKECPYNPKLKQKIKIIDFAVIVLLLAIMILSLWKYQFLNEKITQGAERSGFIMLFFLAFVIEIIPSFFAPIVPLFVNLGAGFSTSLSIFFCVLGSSMGSIFAFTIGKKYGFRYICVLFEPEQWIITNEFLKKYGKIFMLIAAISPLPYLPLLFGAIEIPKKDFLIYGIIPRIIGIITAGVLFKLGIGLFF
jgi:uncharacterized membrane protein YdjX (TVP38/TMEM64 family)